jgi:hypothetical protein
MVMMMMMIPMKPSSMTVTMATISPLLEGISSTDFCPLESFLSLCVFRPAEAAESICDPLPSLRFSGRRYMRRGDGRGGPGRPHHQAARPRAGPRHQVVWAPGGSLRPLLLANILSIWSNPYTTSIPQCSMFGKLKYSLPKHTTPLSFVYMSSLFLDRQFDQHNRRNILHITYH